MLSHDRAPLHLIWVVDCSASMGGDKLQAVTFAIREACPALADAAAENPEVAVWIRVATFANGARWHIRIPVSADHFVMPDLTADLAEERDVNAALCLVGESLAIPPMPLVACRPVLVLVTDGTPASRTLDLGVSVLESQIWGQLAIRMGIAIGAEVDHRQFSRFLNTPEARLFQANNPQGLLRNLNFKPVELYPRGGFAVRTVFDSATPSDSTAPVPLPVPSPAGEPSPNDLW